MLTKTAFLRQELGHHDHDIPDTAIKFNINGVWVYLTPYYLRKPKYDRRYAVVVTIGSVPLTVWYMHGCPSRAEAKDLAHTTIGLIDVNSGHAPEAYDNIRPEHRAAVIKYLNDRLGTLGIGWDPLFWAEQSDFNLDEN